MSDRELFAFAGLWDKWQQDDHVLFTCTILTKDSNEFMKPIHHRMPIILPKNKEDEWITTNITKPSEAFSFLQSVQSEELTSYSVSSHVNSAKNNDMMCIEPLI